MPIYLGKEFLNAIRKHGIKDDKITFLVSSANDNPKKVEGIDVISIGEIVYDRKNDLVIATVKEASQCEVLLTLKNNGFTRTIFLTNRISQLIHN